MGEMQPKSDAQLLREYAEHRVEAAFAEIVHRHSDLVYSAALRQVNSTDVAADVAQKTFVALARSARILSESIAENASLAGWLCRTARNISLNLRRDEFRRQSRERQAMENLDSTPEIALDWERLRPVLDEVMSELSEPDYDALVMRFFKNQDLRSVGLALGVSDDAAQKRVSRALDRLRDLLSQRGITASAIALSTLLAANSVQAAPVGLAATICTATFAGTTLATSTTATTAKVLAMTALQKTLIGAALVAAVGTGIYEAQQASRLRQQVRDLQQQQAEQRIAAQSERADADARLAALEVAIEQATNATEDLTRLRGEVARLRARQPEASRTTSPPHAVNSSTSPDSQADGGELPRQSWADVGFSSPQEALRTRGWAVLNGNRERFKQSLFITPAARKSLEDMIVQRASTSNDPDKARILQQVVVNKYGVEEGILMPIMARNQANNFTGYRIVSEQSPSPNEAILGVETQTASGQSEPQTLKFRRIGSDWKVVIDDDFVKLAR